MADGGGLENWAEGVAGHPRHLGKLREPAGQRHFSRSATDRRFPQVLAPPCGNRVSIRQPLLPAGDGAAEGPTPRRTPARLPSTTRRAAAPPGRLLNVGRAGNPRPRPRHGRSGAGGSAVCLRMMGGAGPGGSKWAGEACRKRAARGQGTAQRVRVGSRPHHSMSPERRAPCLSRPESSKS